MNTRRKLHNHSWALSGAALLMAAATATGDEVPIEQRASEEVRGEHAADVAVANPAFDVTPSELVTGIITEHGIAESATALQAMMTLTDA